MITVGFERSPASVLASMSEAERTKWVSKLTDYDALRLQYQWRGFWARPSQLAPDGDWRTWLILAGRGWGKTKTGAEAVREAVERKQTARIALIASTSADARDVMVEGESGILNVFPPSYRPVYEPSKRRVNFHTGTIATLFSAEEPERLRGPQHDFAWADEMAAWKYLDDTWSNLQFGLRRGGTRQIITTTPKPLDLLRRLLRRHTTVVTRGSSYENRENLAEAYYAEVIAPYEGTRLGRQEINAEILEDIEGALWKRDWIDRWRKADLRTDHIKRIVVAIDPAVTARSTSDETGLLVCARGIDDRGYVLDDESGRYTPHDWAGKAVALLRNRQADRLIAEVNNGGDMVETTIRTIDRTVPYKAVHASRGKITRAEPIAAMYEKGQISHVGSYPMLEDELCTYTGEAGERSPNRMDALVWGMTELFLEQQGQFRMRRV